MMWSTSPPAAPPPPPLVVAPPAMSANNALFLIAFGAFLTVAVLPALLAALVKLALLVAAALALAAATNPSDASFAEWIAEQEPQLRTAGAAVPNDATPTSVARWVSAAVRSAIAVVRNEPLVWRTHNVVAFTVVHVPAVERYALGCLGSWRWADAGSTLGAVCRAPWIQRFSRGGVASGLERYRNGAFVDSSRSGYMESSSSSADGVRRRHQAGAIPASVPSAFAEVLEAVGIGSVDSARPATSADMTDRELRTRAMQFKIRKEWKDAARYFLEAAGAALSTLAKTNYRLEAAWCILEDSDKYLSKKAQLIKLVEEVCEELASGGYFDEASRAFAELALRLKRKFPHDLRNEEFARDVALLFVQAKNVAEAGGSSHGAAENALRAAAMYVDVGLWALAEECFESAGEMQLRDDKAALAAEAFGNAVLCRIGQLDMVGAEEMAAKHARLVDSGMAPTDMDMLLASVFKAYGKWSLQILDTACKRYDATRRLAPWQWQCLQTLHNKMTSTDLR